MRGSFGCKALMGRKYNILTIFDNGMAAWVKPTPIWCFYWQNDLSITQNSQMGTVDLVIVMINDALRRVASYKCTLSCA